MVSSNHKKLMDKYKDRYFTVGNSMRCPIHCSCNGGIFKDLEIIETDEVIKDEDGNICDVELKVHSIAVCILCEKKLIRNEMYVKLIGGKKHVIK